MPHSARNHLLRRLNLAVLIIPAIAFVLYFKGLHGPFTFDDILVFPSTQLSDLSFASVMQALSLHNSGIFGRPVSVITFILNHHYLGDGPWGYKVVNFGIHCFNTLLVYTLVLLLCSSLYKRQGRNENTRKIQLIALFCTLLWALHPLQISTVLYIFQRMTLLSSLFTLLALILYIQFRMRESNSSSQKFLLFAGFPVLLVLAIASKENGVLIIPYILLIEWTIFRFSFSNFKDHKSIKIFHSLFIGLPIAGALIILVIKSGYIFEAYSSRDFTLADRLRTEVVALAFYIRLIALPDISQMSLYHDAFPRFTNLQPVVILCASLLASMAVCVLFLRKHAAALALGCGFFLTAHSLESTFIPLELVFEHRNYLAVLGIAFPLSWYAVHFFEKPKLKLTGLAAGFCVMLLLSAQTYSRSLEWSHELYMNQLAVHNKPDSIRAKDILSTTLSNYGKHEEAIALVKTMLEEQPDKPSVYLKSVAIHCSAGLPLEASLDEAANALADNPLSQDVPNAFNALIQMTSNKTCTDLTFQAYSTLTKIATANPDLVMTRVFSGNLHALDAQGHMAIGNNKKAIISLKNALKSSPQHPEFLTVITHLMIEEGALTEANAYLNTLSSVSNRRFSAYAESANNLRERIRQLTLVSEDSEA